MRLHLLAAGTRRPAWEREGYETYAGRMPRECALTLTEISIEKRTRGAPKATLLEREGKRMLRAVPTNAKVVVLDERGRALRTRELAEHLARWMQEGCDVALLIGGPDGLAPQCRARADECWSLSPLTLPHGLARIVLAEQLYRAVSLLKGHPYHRE